VRGVDAPHRALAAGVDAEDVGAEERHLGAVLRVLGVAADAPRDLQLVERGAEALAAVLREIGDRPPLDGGHPARGARPVDRDLHDADLARGAEALAAIDVEIEGRLERGDRGHEQRGLRVRVGAVEDRLLARIHGDGDDVLGDRLAARGIVGERLVVERLVGERDPARHREHQPGGEGFHAGACDAPLGRTIAAQARFRSRSGRTICLRDEPA
jgi:hypothetical protein